MVSSVSSDCPGHPTLHHGINFQQCFPIFTILTLNSAVKEKDVCLYGSKDDTMSIVVYFGLGQIFELTKFSFKIWNFLLTIIQLFGTPQIFLWNIIENSEAFFKKKIMPIFSILNWKCFAYPSFILLFFKHCHCQFS